MTRAHSKLQLKIEYLPLDAIRILPGNPRQHKPSQIALIAASMAEHGNINPLLVDETGVLIAGEARLEAARLAGCDRVPVIRLRHMSAAQKRLYRIADNRIAELGTWSIPNLVAEFTSLEIEMPAMDLQLSGFTLDVIDGFRDTQDAGGHKDDEEPTPAPDPAQAICRPQDLWSIGVHRLICGDATAADTYQQLLGGERAAMIFADSPYNVPIAGHVSGLGKTQHREFVQASGEMSDAEFQQFLLSFMRHCARFAQPGALHYLCMDWRHLRHLLLAGGAAYDELVNLCVWAKTNAGMGSLYRSAHELVAIFKKGTAPHRNNVQLGAAGRGNAAPAGRTSHRQRRPSRHPVCAVAGRHLRDRTPQGRAA